MKDLSLGSDDQFRMKGLAGHREMSREVVAKALVVTTLNKAVAVVIGRKSRSKGYFMG